MTLKIELKIHLNFLHQAYAELFGSAIPSVDDDDLMLDDDEIDRPMQRKMSVALEGKGLAYFGPRQVS